MKPIFLIMLIIQYINEILKKNTKMPKRKFFSMKVESYTQIRRE